MQRRRLGSAFSFLIGAAMLWHPAAAAALTGDISPVHDPSIIQAAGQFYLFCTGPGLPMRTSTDLFHWSDAGSVFPTKGVSIGLPHWTRPFVGSSAGLWAPDICFFHGQYHLYYAASTFGSRHSAIGLVTTPSLDFSEPVAHWTDRGPVLSTSSDSDYNAIDPAVFVDGNDHDPRVWMVFGSWWTGIKLVPLNVATGLLANPNQPPLAIASRPNGAGLEEGYLTRRNGFYYLWASFDHCCRGAASDYNIRVGRSRAVTGPYTDRDHTPLLDGGGISVLRSQGDARGPGSCAILPFAGSDWLVYHFYDAAHHGTPTLQIRPLTYDPDGWPAAGDPIAGPVEPTTVLTPK